MQEKVIKGPLQDKDATPLMWFLLGVYSKNLINDRHEIKIIPKNGKGNKLAD